MIGTDYSLFEQMHLNEDEIAKRMKLLELDGNTAKLLSSQKLVIEENVETIVKEFYKIQTSIEEIMLLIGDADTLKRLQTVQKTYILDLFSGNYDSTYVNNRLRIGMVHKRIGVDSKLYLSSMRMLRELILFVLKKDIPDIEYYLKVQDALDKVIFFDTTLVFDTYIDSMLKEIELQKNRAEMYAMSLEKKVVERTKQLEELAKLDPLTNIYNHRTMISTLEKELAVSKRRNSTLSFIYFDVDNFKEINDLYGHLKGDEVLKFIAQSMQKCIREIDTPCRYGGDEFCIILPECNEKEAKQVCKRVVEAFTHEYPSFSLSIGIAHSDERTPMRAQELIKQADENMYKAKKENGSHICHDI